MPWGRDLLSPGCPPCSDLWPYVGWMSPESLSLFLPSLCASLVSHFFL